MPMNLEVASMIGAFGQLLGSRQAALMVQMLGDELISGTDADIGRSHEVSLMVNGLFRTFGFGTILDKR